MEIDDPVRLDTRLSGQINRYHTWPTIGKQTIAEHCWNLLRIYYSVVGSKNVDVNLVYAMVFHDIGETLTGDLPYPVKKDNTTLKQEVDHLELKSYCKQLQYWDAFDQVLLREEDRTLFKQIEMIEMAEFGLHQISIGNRHGQIIADRCLQAVYEWNPKPPSRLIKYIVKRLYVFYEQVHNDFWIRADHKWWYIQPWEKLNGKHGAHETSSGNNAE